MQTSPAPSPQQILINTRTLRIGHQTYQLQNLARVQTVTLPRPVGAGKGKTGLAWAAGILVYLFVVVPLSAVAQNGAIAFLGLFAAIGLGIFVYQKTKVPYVPQYALVLETTGSPQVALVSPDYTQLNNLSSVIVDSIENPPEAEKSIYVSNVTLGDQYNQNGGYNIGRVTNP